jgi:hypothetical protein
VKPRKREPRQRQTLAFGFWTAINGHRSRTNRQGEISVKRLLLSLLVFVPLCALLGAVASKGSGGWGWVIGGLLGILVGVVFGGAIAADSGVARFLFGPEDTTLPED